jgi:hypothetical protein
MGLYMPNYGVASGIVTKAQVTSGQIARDCVYLMARGNYLLSIISIEMSSGKLRP